MLSSAVSCLQSASDDASISGLLTKVLHVTRVQFVTEMLCNPGVQSWFQRCDRLLDIKRSSIVRSRPWKARESRLSDLDFLGTSRCQRG